MKGYAMRSKTRLTVILAGVFLLLILGIILMLAITSGDEITPVEAESVDNSPKPVQHVEAPLLDLDGQYETQAARAPDEAVEVEKQPTVSEQQEEDITVAEPENESEGTEDVMGALEYRDEFRPYGFMLAELPGHLPNPTSVSQEALATMRNMIGTNVEIKRGYMCTLWNEEERALIQYYVWQADNNRNALQLERAFRQKTAEQPMTRADIFVARNCVVVVSGKPRQEDKVGQLLVTLKDAVGLPEHPGMN